MAENKITETIEVIGGRDVAEPEVAHPATKVVLDTSTPSVRSIVRVVLITLLILFVADSLKGILTSLTYLFFLVILSVFFAYLIEPLVKIIRSPFEKANVGKYMPRPLAIATAYLTVFLVLGGTIAILSPVVAEQARQLTVNVPAYTASIQKQFRDVNNRYERYKIPDSVQEEINAKAASLFGVVSAFVTNFFIALFSYLPWLILIPILAFFFLKDANLFRVSLLKAFPTGNWRNRVELILHDVNVTLAAYVRAQIISCVLIGILCTMAFYLLGVDYALLLGVLAGIFEFIPLIGPVTIGIIVTSVATLESPWEGIYVFIFLATLRVLQDYVFYPRIVREGIHLHPLAIILSVLAGEQIAGIPGIFLSIPVIALVTVLYKHILEHHNSTGIGNIIAPKDMSEESGKG